MDRLFSRIIEKTANIPDEYRVTKHKPCYFYHISHSMDDKYKTVFPRKVCGEAEVSHVHRFCVAPTVEQCLSALCDYPTGNNFNWSIYRTKRLFDESILPAYVEDYALTQERWLTQRVKMVKVGEIRTTGHSSIIANDERFRLDFSCRGIAAAIHIQYDEYTRLKEFVERNESHSFFDNEDEAEIHRQQRRLNLRFNR